MTPQNLATAISLSMAPRGPIPLERARELWRTWCVTHGYATVPTITQPGATNTKVAKNAIRTVNLTLSPASSSGDANTCTFAGVCITYCVVAKVGKGPVPSVQRGRALRTTFALHYPTAFATIVRDELERASADGPVLFRDNVGQDVPWERLVPWMREGLTGRVLTYGYTKYPLALRVPSMDALRLTYSLNEGRRSVARALEYLHAGWNVTVIVRPDVHAQLVADGVATFDGLPTLPTIDGYVTDDRWSDTTGAPRYVILPARGRLATAPAAPSGTFVRVPV